VTWRNVDELTMEDKPKGKVFSWTLWKYSLDTSCIRGNVNVRVRAYDNKGNI